MEKLYDSDILNINNRIFKICNNVDIHKFMQQHSDQLFKCPACLDNTYNFSMRGTLLLHTLLVIHHGYFIHQTLPNAVTNKYTNDQLINACIVHSFGKLLMYKQGDNGVFYKDPSNSLPVSQNTLNVIKDKIKLSDNQFQAVYMLNAMFNYTKRDIMIKHYEQLNPLTHILSNAYNIAAIVGTQQDELNKKQLLQSLLS